MGFIGLMVRLTVIDNNLLLIKLYPRWRGSSLVSINIFCLVYYCVTLEYSLISLFFNHIIFNNLYLQKTIILNLEFNLYKWFMS